MNVSTETTKNNTKVEMQYILQKQIENKNKTHNIKIIPNYNTVIII